MKCMHAQYVYDKFTASTTFDICKQCVHHCEEPRQLLGGKGLLFPPPDGTCVVI